MLMFWRSSLTGEYLLANDTNSIENQALLPLLKRRVLEFSLV